MKSKGRELAMAEPYSRANAAAWAWYMHGEKGKSSVSEIWFSSKSPVYRPSRFRQEAMKQSSAQIVALKHGSDRYDMMNLGLDFGSSLFDSYEIVALSDQLDKSLYGFLEEHAASSRKDHASSKKDHAVHKPSSEDLLSSSYLKDDNVKNSSKLLVQSKDCDGPIEDYSYRIKRHIRGRFSKAFQSWLGLKSCTSFSSRVDCADLDIEDDHVYHHSHEHHHYHHHHHHYQDCHIDASKHDHLMLEFGSPQVLEVILHHALQSK